MTTEKGIAVREDKAVALYELKTRFAMAVRQRELLENYIKERLKPQKHFYTIDDEPGRKPSLTKEGAELICLPHALKGHYHWIFGPDNPPLDDTPYQITMKCELEANGNFAGDGVGSASSHITRKDGTRVIRQKDPGLRHNATVKMACKSAYIAATLNSTAASEFFTQDLEDDQAGKEPVDKTKHWCSVHNTDFFMRGKMKSFAHPVEGQKDWCYEPHLPDVKQAEKDTKDLWPDGKPAPEPTIEREKQATVALKEETSPPVPKEGKASPEIEKNIKDDKPTTKEGLYFLVADAKAWKSTKPVASWLMGVCHIPEERINNDPAGVWDEVSKLIGKS